MPIGVMKVSSKYKLRIMVYIRLMLTMITMDDAGCMVFCAAWK